MQGYFTNCITCCEMMKSSFSFNVLCSSAQTCTLTTIPQNCILMKKYIGGDFLQTHTLVLVDQRGFTRLVENHIVLILGPHCLQCCIAIYFLKYNFGYFTDSCNTYSFVPQKLKFDINMQFQSIVFTKYVDNTI